jgi:hypothetical protein
MDTYPYINLSFPSGNTYQIPTLIVVRDRANQEAEECATDDIVIDREAALLKWTEYFTNNPKRCLDWLRDNMTMDEVIPHARLVACDPPPELWSDVDARLHREIEKLPPITPESFYRVSAHAFMQDASNSGQALKVNGIVDEAGVVRAAICVLQGDPRIIDGYLDAMAQYTEFLVNPTAAEKSRIILPN